MTPPRLITLGALVALTALTTLTSPVSEARSTPGRLFVVQAVPGATYAVSVDGEQQESGVGVGAVTGPYDVTAGDHTVEFTPESGGPIAAQVSVQAGVSSDLVLHLPAEKGGDPVADVYRATGGPVAAGTARVLVAHTATVPPADVQVDGQTVFEDIANGEFAVADVPAGTHSAAIVAAGTKGPPLLGPLDVDLAAGTLTMVYAVGSPTDGSMNVISHDERVATRADARPSEIHTGSAGLVRGRPVLVFGPS